ncbi:MAG: hypothetical protein ACLQU5_18335 [Isosphaeraceae bacterium]
MRVVGIHGIGQTFKGAAQLKPEWLAAINAGLEEVKGPKLGDGDFAMVGFGPVFRPDGTRCGCDSPIDLDDIDPDKLDADEQAVLVAWWEEAARLAAAAPQPGNDPERDEEPTIQGNEEDTRVRVPALVQRALRQLTKSRFFSAVSAQNVLLFGLRQVRQFLHAPDIKAKVFARVDEAITTDTRVVVAHSLGSIVAYEALCRETNWNVDTLVTLGSPLGIRKLIFDVLTPKPVGGVGAWPRVRRWVNVADEGDIVALVKDLGPLFKGVEDVRVYNGWQSHDGARYLNSKPVGAAVAAALAKG